MTEYDVFPDVEALCNEALREANISSVGTRVYASIPKTPTYPLIVTKRIGGLPVERHRIDRARIQVDVWGNTKAEAFDAAAEARTVLHEMEGTTVTNDPVSGTVTGVEDDLGMTWLPDTTVTDKDRYTFGVSVYAHA